MVGESVTYDVRQEKKPMKRRVISLLILAAAVAGGWFYWESTAERRSADRIIVAIEDYRKTHGRLPDSRDHEVMKSLGFQLRAVWHPDYQVGEKGLYRITILEGFDGPYWTYDSFSQMWRKDFSEVGRPIANNQAEQGVGGQPATPPRVGD